ncbi:MAG TPA: hypothetical protein VJJ73_01030 [Candidatus Paceibacterota bacterium]
MKKINPVLALRLGLGIMYLYSGYDIIRHPTAWTWAIRPLPQFIQLFIENTVGVIRYLQIQGGIEFLFGIIFLAWFTPRAYVKWAAGLSTIEMAVILFLVGVDSVTFRDFGVLGASLALWIYSLKQYGTVK